MMSSTTLTLDDDVADLLQSEVRRSGMPFKQAVNCALRLGLRTPSVAAKGEPFVIKPIHALLPPGWTSGSVQELLNLMDDDSAA